MKNFLIVSALLIFNLGFSQNETASNDDGFDDFEIEMSDIDKLGITANIAKGEIVFNAPNEVDLINIYDAYGQEIYSAKGTIIEDSKIDVSFLPRGKFYLEVVIGEYMGAHQLEIQ